MLVYFGYFTKSTKNELVLRLGTKYVFVFLSFWQIGQKENLGTLVRMPLLPPPPFQDCAIRI
jgi:hypothetical protein